MDDPIFPGYEKLEKSVFQYFQDIRNSKNPFSNISRIGLNQKNPFSNISRILENVADLNFQYFQAGNNSFSIVFHIIAILGLT